MNNRRPTDRRLTLIEVNYWILTPSLGLESLQSTGKIDVDALRKLNSLVDLIRQLTREKPIPALKPTPMTELAYHINEGLAVDEAQIEAARAWVDQARRLLLVVQYSTYRSALKHLVLVSESRVLLNSDEQPESESESPS